MFDAGKLWRERLGAASKEIGRYARYIFNGHIVLVLVFLLGTASFYYQAWVQTLTPEFPAALVMAILIGIVATYSPIFTFLLDPDKIFLLPLEDKLAPYFRRSQVLSLLVGVYLLTIVLAVFMPIYAQVTGEGFSRFLPFLVLISVLKWWNLLIRWKVLHHVERSTHLIDSTIRFVLNATFLFLVFSGANLWVIVCVAVLFVFLYAGSRSQAKSKGLKWEVLIQLEEKRMMSFYRLANLFTDVPKLKDAVKRRKRLDFIVSKLAFRQNATYTHLFVITFLRGGDYLGLWLRLGIIGALALYFAMYGYGQILLIVLVLYLTGFQILPLWNHQQNKLWIRLYPVKEEWKKRSFMRLLFQVLCGQTALLTLPLVLKTEWVISFGALTAGVLFSYLYVYLYVNKKIM